MYYYRNNPFDLLFSIWVDPWILLGIQTIYLPYFIISITT